MDEQTVAIVSTEGAIKRAVRQVRAALAAANLPADFNFRVEASGRVTDGEVKLAFRLGPDGYSSGAVEGNSIEPVVSEYLRRHGWKKVNAPLAISFQEVPS